MIKLKQVTIHKFKCVEVDQTFDVEPGITVFVGMNESGKTSVLQALAKSRYFSNDPEFSFNPTHDYPRKEKKRMDKSGQNPTALTCTFSIGDELADLIADDVGEGVLASREFSQYFKYDNSNVWKAPQVAVSAFVKLKTKALGISSKTLDQKLEQVSSSGDLESLIASYQDEKIRSGLRKLEKFYANKWNWSGHPVSEYIARVFLISKLPKFLYYDEYYALPSRISIEKLRSDTLEEDDLKTAKALFELADINIDEVVGADDFEDFKAELEATEATITEELFEYWSTNTNLEIQFAIDKVEESRPGGTRIVEHILDIRVRNNRTRMSLPLKQRSKGFNWFFSFLVWFKKIQEDSASNYVLLLDEPGLNLHASAQEDLLDFIEDLSKDYQVIYTTHSPFMVNPQKLNRVRTIVETPTGSRISDSVQEKDPDTLFPLQAALGYDIAQNLFITKNNLLVEGVSDLVYLQHLSEELESAGRAGLRNDITIVPMGGLDKVSTFVSLLRGSSLSIVCLMDSTLDNASKAQIENLVRERLVKKSKIRAYDEFTGRDGPADVEDMFERDEYLAMFNEAFREHGEVSLSELDPRLPRIVQQINERLGVQRFNHYRPARTILTGQHEFSEQTLGRFEALFKRINGLF